MEEEIKNTEIEFESEKQDNLGRCIEKTRCKISSPDVKEAERLFIKFFVPEKMDAKELLEKMKSIKSLKKEFDKISKDIVVKKEKLDETDEETGSYIG